MMGRNEEEEEGEISIPVTSLEGHPSWKRSSRTTSPGIEARDSSDDPESET